MGEGRGESEGKDAAKAYDAAKVKMQAKAEDTSCIRILEIS